jgi:Tfp pilus assembly PilM family ATPase
MPQLLALEWNAHEARAAVASRHGHRVVIEQAFAVPLQPATEEGSLTDQGLAQSIAEALVSRGIGQLDALVAVGRGSVELRQLQLPAASDGELPEMVRLRAMLEFNELDDKWLLDFVPIDDANKSHRNVLAAAIAPAVIERIHTVCQRSGQKIQRVLLRSCEAAALLARSHLVQPGRVQLLVETFCDQVGLTAVVDGQVLLPRMVRFSGDASDSVALRALLTEIRLTMAAVQNQSGGRQVTGVVLCGRGEADAAVARQIEEAVGTRTTLLDPFAGLELGPQLLASLPEHPGRFAAVLGMLLKECAHDSHAIDFLHPRHAVVPADPRKKWGIAAAVAAILLAVYFLYGRWEYGRLEEEVQQLEIRSAEADRILRTAGTRNLTTAGDIANWADGEVIWLDRLQELSKDFPPADVATINHLMATRQSDPATGTRLSGRTSAGEEVQGRMHLEGWARDGKAVSTMEQSLRAHDRRLESSKSNDDRSVQPYTVKFRSTLQVGQGAKP